MPQQFAISDSSPPQIELDIDPDDKVRVATVLAVDLADVKRARCLDHAHQGEGRGAVWCTTSSATIDLCWATNVRHAVFLT